MKTPAFKTIFVKKSWSKDKERWKFCGAQTFSQKRRWKQQAKRSCENIVEKTGEIDGFFLQKAQTVDVVEDKSQDASRK